MVREVRGMRSRDESRHDVSPVSDRGRLGEAGGARGVHVRERVAPEQLIRHVAGNGG